MKRKDEFDTERTGDSSTWKERIKKAVRKLWGASRDNSEARTHRSRLSTLAAHQAKCQAAGREGRDQAKAGVLDLLVLLALHYEVSANTSLTRSPEPFDAAPTPRKRRLTWGQIRHSGRRTYIFPRVLALPRPIATTVKPNCHTLSGSTDFTTLGRLMV